HCFQVKDEDCGKAKAKDPGRESGAQARERERRGSSGRERRQGRDAGGEGQARRGWARRRPAARGLLGCERKAGGRTVLRELGGAPPERGPWPTPDDGLRSARGVPGAGRVPRASARG